MATSIQHRNTHQRRSVLISLGIFVGALSGCTEASRGENGRHEGADIGSASADDRDAAESTTLALLQAAGFPAILGATRDDGGTAAPASGSEAHVKEADGVTVVSINGFPDITITPVSDNKEDGYVISVAGFPSVTVPQIEMTFGADVKVTRSP